MENAMRWRFIVGICKKAWLGLSLLLVWACRDAASEPFIPLAQTPFLDLEHNSAATLPGGRAGYLVYYINPSEDCGNCLVNLAMMNTNAEVYPDIALVYILRKDGSPRDLNSFLEDMAMSGRRFHDKRGILAGRFHLIDEPFLLVLNRDLRLVNLFRHQDLTAMEPAHFHQVLQSL